MTTGDIVISDYECPMHGVFEVGVDLDEHGQPPAAMPCEELEEDRMAPTLRRCRAGRESPRKSKL